MSIDYRCAFLMWMVVVQYVMLFATTWPLVVSESSRGIVGFIQRDFYIKPEVIAVLFLFSIGITWRGIRARWWLLLMLTGQGVYALAALAYAIHSDITLTQFAGHGGLFLLCGAAITASIPLPNEREYLYRLKTLIIQFSKTLQIPTIGVVLLLYAVGLTARPDAGIALFIESQFGWPLILGLAVTMGLGAAVTIQNHIRASRLFVALIPQIVYATLAIMLLPSDNNVSLAGVMVHVLFSITALFVVVIQTGEYARAVLLQQRRGA